MNRQTVEPSNASYNYPMPRRLAPLLLLALACTRTVTAPAPAPAPGVARRPALPAVPAVDGPLAINVVYPRPDQVITSRDSNFIFGSIGSGRATLRINGAPARVYPNGAFIAFVANPPGPSPRYELLAERGGESIRTTLNVAYPPVRDAVAPSPAAPATRRRQARGARDLARRHARDAVRAHRLAARHPRAR